MKFGTLWILYQINRNQLNFKVYLIRKDLDGLLFGKVINRYQNEKSIQSNKINQRKKSSPKHNCMKEDVDFNGSF
jgi:hypothetical protein